MVKRSNISAGLVRGILIISSLMLPACGGLKNANTGANSQAKQAPTVVEVTTFKAVSRQVPVYIQATGSLVAQEQSDIAPQVSGQIIATPVDVGAFVGQGNVIARLDDRDARLRLQQAQSNEQQAQS